MRKRKDGTEKKNLIINLRLFLLGMMMIQAGKKVKKRVVMMKLQRLLLNKTKR